jgi:hypothetical protein
LAIINIFETAQSLVRGPERGILTNTHADMQGTIHLNANIRPVS